MPFLKRGFKARGGWCRLGSSCCICRREDSASHGGSQAPGAARGWALPMGQRRGHSHAIAPFHPGEMLTHGRLEPLACGSLSCSNGKLSTRVRKSVLQLLSPAILKAASSKVCPANTPHSQTRPFPVNSWWNVRYINLQLIVYDLQTIY